MSTEIWKANIVLEQHNRQVRLENVAVKKLPPFLLIADTHFVKSLMLKLGKDMEKGRQEWDKVKIKNDFPMIKIEYISYLGDTAEEPYICGELI